MKTPKQIWIADGLVFTDELLYIEYMYFRNYDESTEA